MAPIGVEKPRRARFFFIVAGYSEFSEVSEVSEDTDGMEGNFDSFEKSRNAFGTAHRPGGRLLLCDFLEHFVVGKVGKKGKFWCFHGSLFLN